MYTPPHVFGRHLVRCTWRRSAWYTVMASAMMSSAHAQYTYSPAAADELPGIRYFGSAKDEKGALLPDVSVEIDMQNISYLFVTDEQGRYRVNLPLDMRPENVTLKCFKAGFQLVRVNKRPGPAGPKLTVQADCVLRAAQS